MKLRSMQWVAIIIIIQSTCFPIFGLASGKCVIQTPFCDLPYDSRIYLPESLLHDVIPLEFLNPQTSVFVDKPIEVIKGIKAKYPHIDPKGEIEPRALELALSYFEKLKPELKRTDFLGLINYNLHSHEPRFYLLDMNSGIIVEKLLVAHGEGSDPKNSGVPSLFSNITDSHMSSIGAFITAETYRSNNVGYALRLDGIEPSNSKMRSRGVVIHGSEYVQPDLNPIGMSWGCPAIHQNLSKKIIDQVKGGVLFYSWYNQ